MVPIHNRKSIQLHLVTQKKKKKVFFHSRKAPEYLDPKRTKISIDWLKKMDRRMEKEQQERRDRDDCGLD